MGTGHPKDQMQTGAAVQKVPSDAELRESLKRPGNGKGPNANAVGIQYHAAIIDNAVNQSAMS